MIVYDNIVFLFKLRKVLKDEIDRCVREVVEMFGFMEFFNRKLREFLGG